MPAQQEGNWVNLGGSVCGVVVAEWPVELPYGERRRNEQLQLLANIQKNTNKNKKQRSAVKIKHAEKSAFHSDSLAATFSGNCPWKGFGRQVGGT